MSQTHPMTPQGDCLIARLTPETIGRTPQRVWNPTPSETHRTAPYDLPQNIGISIRGTQETGAKFAPSPFVVVVESNQAPLAIAVHAHDTWHRFNRVDFHVDTTAVTVTIDLEGHTPPTAAAPHITVVTLQAQPDETHLDLVARINRLTYPAASTPTHIPDWWLKPIYCGWGDQVTIAQYLEGVGPEARALPYCTQGLHERWINRLEQADVPFGTVCIDHGWSPAGSWETNTERWPDLKAFIAKQHAAGRKVLLWIATWYWDGIPDEWCIFIDGQKLCVDPTHPDYQDHVRRQVTHLLSPQGLDADGFKIDQLSWSPSERYPIGGQRFGTIREYPIPTTPITLAGDTWGVELLHLHQKTIYDAAKAAKPDALVTSSTVHPYFHDTFDMVRLHDTGAVDTDIFDAMGARAALSRSVFPHKPIDADDWISMDYDKWLLYTSESRRIGVPCIFFTEHFMLNWKQEPATTLIPLEDLRKIGNRWRATNPT